MIRRSVRRLFHHVSWVPPSAPLPQPCVVIANHHGWHDGYVMYVAARKLKLPIFMWIQEYGAFPLFGKAGGLPFPVDDGATRAVTIRKTIRALNQGTSNLVLFPEGVMHRPPGLLPFGDGLDLLIRKVPNVTVVPVAIRYDKSMHERPECYIEFGPSLGVGQDPRTAVESVMVSLEEKLRSGQPFELLAKGTSDINERWDVRKFMKS